MAFEQSGVEIREAGAGELLRTLSVDGDDYTRSIAISPDASRIAWGHQSGKVRVWDVETGTIIHSLTTRITNKDDFAFLPDGKFATFTFPVDASQLGIDDSTDDNSRTSPWRYHLRDTNSRSMHLASDSFVALQASGPGQLIQLGRVTTGQPLPGTSRGRSSLVRSLSFSSDGEWLVAVFHDGVVKIWDTTKIKMCSAAPVLRWDGWLVGTGGELLLWIPEHLRRNLEWDDSALLDTLGVKHPLKLEIATLREDDWLAFKREPKRVS